VGGVAAAISAADWYRRDFSFVSALPTIVLTSPRSPRSTVCSGVGSSCTIVRTDSATLAGLTLCGSFPHNSWYAITPSAYTSERVSISAGSPAACSGDMYATVPTICPALVCSVVCCESGSIARATPKSRIFGCGGVADSSTRMLSGLRSR
jgi:hypothetical protein